VSFGGAWDHRIFGIYAHFIVISVIYFHYLTVLTRYYPHSRFQFLSSTSETIKVSMFVLTPSLYKPGYVDVA
jgi:hypothetical protein